MDQCANRFLHARSRHFYSTEFLRRRPIQFASIRSRHACPVSFPGAAFLLWSTDTSAHLAFRVWPFRRACGISLRRQHRPAFLAQAERILRTGSMEATNEPDADVRASL